MNINRKSIERQLKIKLKTQLKQLKWKSSNWKSTEGLLATLHSKNIFWDSWAKLVFALVQKVPERPNSEILKSGNIALSTLHMFCGLWKMIFRAQRGKFFKMPWWILMFSLRKRRAQRGNFRNFAEFALSTLHLAHVRHVWLPIPKS